MHALKDRQRPAEIAQYVGRDRARKTRRILPEIRSGRDWTRGPRRIPPEGLSVCASRPPLLGRGGLVSPLLDRGDRARPASAAMETVEG